MADTRRSVSALQTLYADNSSGAITAQDARDELVSSHPTNVSQTGTFASEPTSGQLIGDVYLPSDSFYAERWDGSVWQPWGPIFKMTRPPATGAFTAVNQGSATIASTNGGLFFTSPGNSGADAVHLFKKVAPSTPWTLTVALIPLWFSVPVTSHGVFCGILFRESSSGKFVLFNLASSPTCSQYGGIGLDVMKWTDASTFSARYTTNQATASTQNYGIPQTVLYWLRISDDGTNRICSFSYDGQNFCTMHSVGRTDFLTANEIGFGGYSYATTDPNAAFTLVSWKEA